MFRTEQGQTWTRADESDYNCQLLANKGADFHLGLLRIADEAAQNEEVDIFQQHHGIPKAIPES